MFLEVSAFTGEKGVSGSGGPGLGAALSRAASLPLHRGWKGLGAAVCCHGSPAATPSATSPGLRVS